MKTEGIKRGEQWAQLEGILHKGRAQLLQAMLFARPLDGKVILKSGEIFAKALAQETLELLRLPPTEFFSRERIAQAMAQANVPYSQSFASRIVRWAPIGWNEAGKCEMMADWLGDYPTTLHVQRIPNVGVNAARVIYAAVHGAGLPLCDTTGLSKKF